MPKSIKSGTLLVSITSMNVGHGGYLYKYLKIETIDSYGVATYRGFDDAKGELINKLKFKSNISEILKYYKIDILHSFKKQMYEEKEDQI